MSGFIYQIPASAASLAGDESVIIRGSDPVDLLLALEAVDAGNVLYITLPVSTAEHIEITRIDNRLPVSFFVNGAKGELSRIYQLLPFIRSRRTRVSSSLHGGCLEAVRLAASLDIPVKLEVGQPAPEQIEVLRSLLDFYLYGRGNTQPIEFFHSVFHSMLHEQEANLWSIQEDDPKRYRYISDEGREYGSERLMGVELEPGGESWSELIPIACRECAYVQVCQGYFKWPDNDYDCSGISTIFEALTSACRDLKNDLAELS